MAKTNKLPTQPNKCTKCGRLIADYNKTLLCGGCLREKIRNSPEGKEYHRKYYKENETEVKQ